MTSAGVCFFLLLQVLDSVSGNPVFPAGVDRILSNIVKTQSRVDGAIGDDVDKVDRLTQRGADNLEESLLDEAAHRDLSQIAYSKVHARLLRQLYAGGCPRTYKDCPQSWVMNASLMCQPPSDYEGLCASFSLAEFDRYQVMDKESFAWKCRLSWPCISSCPKNFQSCPESWQNVEGLCVAPLTYTGICSPAIGFAHFTVNQKVEWSTLCDAPWPCQQERREGSAQVLAVPDGPLA